MTPSDFGVLENVRAITQQNTPNTQNVETDSAIVKSGSSCDYQECVFVQNYLSTLKSLAGITGPIILITSKYSKLID